MEKTYKIQHIPTGKYLSKFVSAGRHVWGLGPNGKAWSKKLHYLIKGGVLIDGKLIPESEFVFVEFIAKPESIKDSLIEEIKALKDTNKYNDTYDCAWRDGNNSAIENVIAIIEKLKI